MGLESDEQISLTMIYNVFLELVWFKHFNIIYIYMCVYVYVSMCVCVYCVYVYVYMCMCVCVYVCNVM